jgi:hypothetical protein
MLLKNQRDTRKRIEFVTNVAFKPLDESSFEESKPHATPWTGDTKTLVRILYVPDGMSVDAAQRIVDRTN